MCMCVRVDTAGTQVRVSAPGGWSVPLAQEGTEPGTRECTPCEALRPPQPPATSPPHPPTSSRPTSGRPRPTSANTHTTHTHTSRPASGHTHTNSNGQNNRFVVVEGEVVVPRVPYVHVMAYVHMGELQACGWLPMLTFPVEQQAQHIVDTHQEPDIPHVSVDQGHMHIRTYRHACMEA